MAKKQYAEDQVREAKPPVEQPEPVEKETTTFSVRLTDQQSELIRRAAEIRGWSPTALLRNAALERAAHIVNTSRVTQFDFRGLAQKLAELLFKNRRYSYSALNKDDVTGWEPVGDVNAALAELGLSFELDATAEPDRLPISALAEMSRALRLGGAEFLNMVVECCEALTVSERKSELPEPVDPASLGAGDRS